jgi:hypothetical protein
MRITFDLPKLHRLKAVYESSKLAGLKGSDVFHFEGSDFVMDYARYLIEYLESKLL